MPGAGLASLKLQRLPGLLIRDRGVPRDWNAAALQSWGFSGPGDFGPLELRAPEISGQTNYRPKRGIWGQSSFQPSHTIL